MTLEQCVIQISNHARLSNVARRVRYDFHSHSRSQKQIILKCQVEHYDAATGADLSGDVPTREIQLEANNRNWIDTTTFQNVAPAIVPIFNDLGDQIGQKTEYPEGSINEYAYWVLFFENPIPDFFGFLTQILALRASQGRFD